MHRRHFFKLFAGISVGGLSGFRWPYGRRDRIAVVGGGIIGSSIAYHLARRGAEVFLFEKERPAGGATGKSFAWINATFGKQPQHYHYLNRLSMLAYAHLERELSGELPVQWGGSLRWYQDPERSRELRSQVRRHQEWGYSARLVDEEEFRKLEPNIVPGPVLAAAFCEQEGSLDPVKATEILLKKARRELGVRVEYPCEVTGLDIRWGRLHGVKTTCGDFQSDMLVIAAGVDTPRVAAMAGLEVPLGESPGLLAHGKPTSRLISRVVLAPGAHMKQKCDGRIVTGAGFGGSPVTDASREQGQRVLEKAEAFLPQLKNVELERVTLGWRPLPKDGHPIVGFADCCPDIYLAVMHSGVTLSPLIGRLAALEILDDVRVDLLQHYRLSRFPYTSTR